MIGRTLSHFRIVEKIGEGGMGVVYRAEDTDLRRPVALKVLPPELVGNEERRLRFVREARAAAAVTHPNIATIHEIGEARDDSGEGPSVVFIAMELVEGKTLRDHIAGRSMLMKDALRIATEMAEGLAEAHKAGVVHRDFKPDNVIVGSNGHAKILDFGLAKLLEERSGKIDPAASKMDTISGEMTREGKIFGTAAYMSPEQARGKEVGAGSDIFSFGTTLYEMVTGKVPFQGDTSTDILSAITRDEPAPPSQQNREIPPKLEEIISQCLEKDPRDRYLHADQLAADLRKVKRVTDSGVQVVRTPSGPTAVLTSGFWRLPIRGRSARWGLGVALIALAGFLGYVGFRSGGEPGETGASQEARQMIVVLPFDNLGSSEDDYFAAGMTEEITSRLAVVRGLGVISRKSALQYANTTKRTKQIGEELGVEYVLEGSVRWARSAAGSSRVRITPQLIRVSDDTALWAETYDRTIDDIFEIQSEIAEKVIEQLGVTLLDRERRAVDARPTENLEAYQAYLQGLRNRTQGAVNFTDLKMQMQMFERAVELDPDFALAHAELSQMHSNLYHMGWDRTDERLKMAQGAVDRALELAPDVPEVHLALGLYHYWGNKEYDRALEEFSLAEREMPNNADLYASIGFVRRRQGIWEDALQNLQRAFELDPLRAEISWEIGMTYMLLRRYPEALSYFEQSIALAPNQIPAYASSAAAYRFWKGTTRKAREVLETMPETSDPLAIEAWFWQEMAEGRYRQVLERLSSSGLEVIESLDGGLIPVSLFEALAHGRLNESEDARRAYAAALEMLEDLARERREDPYVEIQRGIALAGLGRVEEAIQAGRRAVELYPVSLDAFGGTDFVERLALIYTMVGEHDAALDELESLLSSPGWSRSAHELKLNPVWEPLRNHPQFKKLVERFGQIEG
ncbi:MAG: protein kinase [Acidobacteriota bacterium]